MSKKTPLKMALLLGRMLKHEERTPAKKSHLECSGSCKGARLAGMWVTRGTVAQMKVLGLTEVLIRNLDFI